MSGQLLYNLIKEDYGIEGNGRWYRAKKHDSLVLDKKEGLFYWNSRGLYGTLEEYLKFVRGVDKVPEWAKTTPVSVEREEDVADVVVHSKLKDVFYNNGLSKREYWYNRLLSDKTIDRFKLGWYNDWYTIPVERNDQLLDIQLRREKPEKQIKTWYRGVGPLLFNSDVLDVINTVIFTEGIVDAILLAQYGLPAISKTTGASAWKNEWFRYFTKTRLIYLVYDNDDAGRLGVKRMAEMIGSYRCLAYTFDDFDDKYDVIDYFRDGNTVDEFKKLVFQNAHYVF